MTAEDVRQVALSLPGSAERPYTPGLPCFRVGGQLFPRIRELPDVFFVRCTGLEERDELLKSGPGKLFITLRYQGNPGILVRLSQVDPGEMTEIVTDAWGACPPKRGSSTAKPGTHPHRNRHQPGTS